MPIDGSTGWMMIRKAPAVSLELGMDILGFGSMGSSTYAWTMPLATLIPLASRW